MVCQRKNLFGFTFIELMIVIAILGILAAMISGNFITSLKKGRDARRKTDLQEIQKSLEMYYEDKKAYPVTADVSFGGQLCYPGASGCSVKIYMQKVPNDPTASKSYAYVQFGSGIGYGLYSCLENTEQILPYVSLNFGSFSCTTQCKKPDGSATTTGCVWGISDTNSTP